MKELTPRPGRCSDMYQPCRTLGYGEIASDAAAQGGHVVHSFDCVQLVDFPKQCRGTTGYVITCRAVATLLQHTETMLRPIDDKIDRAWEHLLRLYGVAQPVIDNTDLPSTITDRTDHKRHPLRKILYAAYALRDLIFRELHNFEKTEGVAAIVESHLAHRCGCSFIKPQPPQTGTRVTRSADRAKTSNAIKKPPE